MEGLVCLSPSKRDGLAREVTFDARALNFGSKDQPADQRI